MELYIRSVKDYSVLAMYDVASTDIVIATMTGTSSGSVTIPTESKEYNGEWAIINGYVGLIESSSFTLKGSTRLTIVDPLKIFDRSLRLYEQPTTYGSFIENYVVNDFVECSDNLYALPYVTVSTSDDTYYGGPELQNDILFNLYDVINSARENLIEVTMVPSKKNITVVIHAASRESHNVTPQDGYTKIDSIDMDYTNAGKFTVIINNDGNYTEYTYYAATDGYLDTTPEYAVKGQWIYIVGSSDDDPYTLALEELNKKVSSHKIEFSTNRKFKLFDYVTIELPFGYMKTVITEISILNDGLFYRYTCGTKPVTLTDKINTRL